MINSLECKIREWIKDQLAHVGLYNLVDIHIDQLLDREIERSEIIETSLRAFTLLIEQLKNIQTPAQPLLVIPLVSTNERIEMMVPNSVNEVVEQLDIEPPSLYLLDWEQRITPPTWERYQIPLPFELLDKPIDGVYTYFHEYIARYEYEHHIGTAWVYGRDIRLEYYPSRYRKT